MPERPALTVRATRHGRHSEGRTPNPAPAPVAVADFRKRRTRFRHRRHRRHHHEKKYGHTVDKKSGKNPANRIGPLPCRTFRPIDEGATEGCRRLSPPSGGDGNSEPCPNAARPASAGEEDGAPRKRCAARSEIAPQDRSSLSGYMRASKVGDETLWTCKRCRRETHERKKDGSLNVGNLLKHVRHCYGLVQSVDQLRSASRKESPTSAAAPIEGRYRVFRIIGDGLASNSVPQPPASTDEDTERSCPGGELSVKGRAAKLANFSQERGAGEATGCTCKKCHCIIHSYKIDGHPDSTDLRIHVHECYGPEECTSRKVMNDGSPNSPLHGDTALVGESRAGPSLAIAPTDPMPSRQTLEQERRMVHHFWDRPSDESGTWTCKKCGDALEQFTDDGGGGGGGGEGKESSVTLFKNLIGHLRGCVGADAVRPFVSLESTDEYRHGSMALESENSCKKKPATETKQRNFQAGDAPCWNMDVVLNAPETPHAGYHTLLNAIKSTTVQRGESRWEYFLFEHVSRTMNAGLPPEARYLIREVDGSFRLAAPLELRGTILEIFSQQFRPRGVTEGLNPSEQRLAAPMGSHEPDGEAVAGGAVPDEVAVSPSFYEDKAAEAPLSRKRKEIDAGEGPPLGKVGRDREGGDGDVGDLATLSSSSPPPPPAAVAEPLQAQDCVLVGDVPMHGDRSHLQW